MPRLRAIRPVRIESGLHFGVGAGSVGFTPSVVLGAEVVATAIVE